MLLRLARRVWDTLAEPPRVTACMVVAYAMAVLGGVLVVLHPTPHPLPYTDAPLLWASTLLLVGGGLVGLPTAWWGWWFAERAAALACFGGTLVMLFETVVLLWPGGPELTAPALTLSAASMACILFLTRWFRTREQPYAPGRGPELPEVQADRLLAHIVAEAREYRAGHATTTD